MGGHYECFVRHQKKQWYLCNDGSVSEVHVNQVLEPKQYLYLLFYHKCHLDYFYEGSDDL